MQVGTDHPARIWGVTVGRSKAISHNGTRPQRSAVARLQGPDLEALGPMAKDSWGAPLGILEHLLHLASSPPN